MDLVLTRGRGQGVQNPENLVWPLNFRYGVLSRQAVEGDLVPPSSLGLGLGLGSIKFLLTSMKRRHS